MLYLQCTFPIIWELTFHEHINQRLRLQICLKFQIAAREPKPFWTAWQEAFPTLMGSPFSLAVRHRRSHQATLSLLLRGCCVFPLIQRTQFSLWASVCFHRYIGLWKAKSGQGGGLISLHHLSNRRIATPRSIHSSDEQNVRQRHRVTWLFRARA